MQQNLLTRSTQSCWAYLQYNFIWLWARTKRESIQVRVTGKYYFQISWYADFNALLFSFIQQSPCHNKTQEETGTAAVEPLRLLLWLYMAAGVRAIFGCGLQESHCKRHCSSFLEQTQTWDSITQTGIEWDWETCINPLLPECVLCMCLGWEILFIITENIITVKCVRNTYIAELIKLKCHYGVDIQYQRLVEVITNFYLLCRIDTPCVKYLNGWTQKMVIITWGS